MTHARTITEHLIEEGKAARTHFQVWWALRKLAIPTYLETMNDRSYTEFFDASNSGHYKLFFISLSKIFDRDNRVAGIHKLTLALRAEGELNLADYVTHELKHLEPLIEHIMHIRNKQIAHNDLSIPVETLYKENGITPNQIREVIDETCDIINYAAEALGFSRRIFKNDRIELATLHMLDTLQRGKNKPTALN